jgi:hypothetical protein
MRGVYVVLREVTITSAGNLIELECGGKSIEILRAWAQAQSPDTVEQMTICLNRITAAGTGGTGLTERSTTNDGTSSAAAAYAGDRAPTAANALDRQSIPNIGGYQYAPTPEERIECNGTSDGIVLRLDEDLSASHVLDCGIIWREIG